MINWKQSPILYLDVISSNDSLEASRHWNICQHHSGDLASTLETFVWGIWLHSLSLHRVYLSDILEFFKQHLNGFYLWSSQIYELLLFSVWNIIWILWYKPTLLSYLENFCFWWNFLLFGLSTISTLKYINIQIKKLPNKVFGCFDWKEFSLETFVWDIWFQI